MIAGGGWREDEKRSKQPTPGESSVNAAVKSVSPDTGTQMVGMEKPFSIHKGIGLVSEVYKEFGEGKKEKKLLVSMWIHVCKPR